MKKIFLVLLAFCSFAGVVNANVEDDAKSPLGMAVMKNGSTFKVFYKGDKTTTVKVTIFNADRKAVFTDVIKNISNFVRPYNFSNLAEGEYTIEVSDGFETRTEKVNYHTGAVQKLVNIKPLAGADKKYILTVTGQADSQESVKIKIYSGDGLIYDKSEEFSGTFGKVFTLNNVTGKVSFEISDKNGILKNISY
jgi:hypothetical protein